VDPVEQRGTVVCHLGRTEYQAAWDLQHSLQSRLIEAKRAGTSPRPPHLLLTVEHPPVFTLGKRGDRRHLVATDDELARRDAAFFHIDRGGDITYHGPGQLVVYPIIDLDRLFRDVHRYLRELEEAVIQMCAAFGVSAHRSEGRTGVWIGPDDNGDERKICAMGIRCSRWVTMHGLAFNTSTDLSYFDMIVPCGISDRGVTSLERETGATPDSSAVRGELIARLAGRFGLTLLADLEEEDARDFLDGFASGVVSAYSPMRN
jgi:lipoyl(octanoyl) transferase